MPSFESFWSGFSFYRANIDIHTHTYTHCDKVIAISTPAYYIIGTDSKIEKGIRNSARELTCVFGILLTKKINRVFQLRRRSCVPIASMAERSFLQFDGVDRCCAVGVRVCCQVVVADDTLVHLLSSLSVLLSDVV